MKYNYAYRLLMSHLRAIESGCDLGEELKPGGSRDALRVVFGRKPTRKMLARLSDQLDNTCTAIDRALEEPGK